MENNFFNSAAYKLFSVLKNNYNELDASVKNDKLNMMRKYFFKELEPTINGLLQMGMTKESLCNSIDNEDIKAYIQFNF